MSRNLATAITTAPQTFPICTAARPTPPAAPRTSSTYNFNLMSSSCSLIHRYTSTTKLAKPIREQKEAKQFISKYLTGCQTSSVNKANMRGSKCNRKRTGSNQITSLWHTKPFNHQFHFIYLEIQINIFNLQLKWVKESDSQVGLIGNDELSKGTDSGDRTNWVSHPELGDGGADGVDDAGIIGARNEREGKLLLVQSLYLQVIGVVQACSFDPHSHRRRRVQLWDWLVLLQH